MQDTGLNLTKMLLEDSMKGTISVPGSYQVLLQSMSGFCSHLLPTLTVL